jgi:hypothetical protein
MKTLNFEQMEVVHGGSDVSAACVGSIASAIILGTGAVIGAASGPVGWLAFAMISNYVGWGWAAYTCYEDRESQEETES